MYHNASSSSSPIVPRNAQPCPGDSAVRLYSSSHQNKITTVLILSVSNSGRSLCKLKSLLSDNVSEETQFILIQDISCHSEPTVDKELQCIMPVLQLYMSPNILFPCTAPRGKNNLYFRMMRKKQSRTLFYTMYPRNSQRLFKSTLKSCFVAYFCHTF